MKETWNDLPLLNQLLHPMTGERILQIVAERGLRIVVLAGNCYLEGSCRAMTKALRDVVESHNDEIVAALRAS